MKKQQFPKPCDTCPYTGLTRPRTREDMLRCDRCERFKQWFAGKLIRAQRKAREDMKDNRMRWAVASPQEKAKQ